MTNSRRYQRGHDGQHHGGQHHDGRIDAGEAADEGLAPRLVFGGVLHQIDNLRHGALAVSLGGAHAYHALLVDAARDDLVADGGIARCALARQRHGVQRRRALDDDAVERNLFARPHHDDAAHGHLIGVHVAQRLPFLLRVRHIGPYVHQVADALAALPLGVALEQLAHLEEEHDEDGLGKLRLGPGQEADGQCADGGHRHEEMLVEPVAVGHAFGSLLQRLVAYQQVGHQIDQQQLPRGQRAVLLNHYGSRQQHGCGNNQQQLAAQAALAVLMMMMFVVFVVLA